ncbi:NAD-dependent protein deacetylase [Aeromicrobium sp.]|uniref:NAD-dependent protein deacetylase n=1 Tax=Aeromicrobium sp. TaxID=1871063 RepID=UPI003D6C31EA
MHDPDPADVERMRDVLRDRRWLVLTGAGVSTDSGIPDYRGPGAPARTPMTYQQFVSGPDAQQRYWARAHLGWRRMRSAEPNATHHRLAALEAEGRLSGLVTQNVDGLHRRAGHRGLIELHGRLDRVVCLDCGERTSRGRVQRRLDALNPGWERDAPVAPDGDVLLEETGGFVVATCERCGGRLKPDVVFFGENVRKETVEHCYRLTDAAEALVVLGSSLQVMSGLRFVRRARANGVPVVIVNRGATRGDDLADARVDAGCAETLSVLAPKPLQSRTFVS